MKASPGTDVQAYLWLVVATLGWGVNAVLARLAVSEVSPMALVVFRWGGVMLLLCIFARSHVLRDWAVLRRHLFFIASIGALGFTGFNTLFYIAAHSTSAINIGIIQGSVPVFVLMGALFVFGTPVSRFQWIGVVVTIVGVVVIACRGELARLSTLDFVRGDLLMLIACLLYSIYAVALRRRPPVSALALFSILAAAAFVSSFPFLAIEVALGQFQWPTAKGWGIILLVTLLPSFLAQIAFINGVSIIGPGRAGVFVNLVPIFASVFAVLVLAEPFKLYHGAALTLVLTGIAMSELMSPGESKM